MTIEIYFNTELVYIKAIKPPSVWDIHLSDQQNTKGRTWIARLACTLTLRSFYSRSVGFLLIEWKKSESMLMIIYCLQYGVSLAEAQEGLKYWDLLNFLLLLDTCKNWTYIFGQSSAVKG